MKTLSFSLILCAGSLALASCSSNTDTPDVPAPRQEAGKIAFSAGVNRNDSRAEATTTNTIKQFQVYAFTDKKPILDNVVVNRVGTSNSWTYDYPQYWPASPVNFYAISPVLDSVPAVSVDAGGYGTIPGYLDSWGQTDLLYAVAMNEVESGTPVNLNFRHALSKVNVLLSCVNSNINVNVANIQLANIYMKGTFHFPYADTTGDTFDVPENTGYWDALSEPTSPFLFMAQTAGDVQTLTSTPTDYAKLMIDNNFFIPQTLRKVTLQGDELLGEYIEVDCTITDKDTGTAIWPNDNTPSYLKVNTWTPEGSVERGRLIFPLAKGEVGSWLPGHAYIYNIVVNDIEMLNKIAFTVTVDNYLTHEWGY